LRNPHPWIVAIIATLLSVIYYRDALGIGLIGEAGSVLALGLTRHTLERILFLIPVAYAAAMLNVRAAIITLVGTAVILFPQAFIFSPEPREALFETGGMLFTGALLLSLIYSLQKRKQQAIELETTNRALRENRELQEKLLRTNRELLTLNDTARTLSQSLDLELVVFSGTRAMLAALEAEVSWVYLADDTIGAPIPYTQNGVSAEAVDKLMEYVRDLASTQKVKASTDRLTLPADDADDGGGSQWYIAVTPLETKDAVLGTAGVATTRLPFDEQHIRLLSAIGNQIATALERSRLYSEVQVARDVRGELLRKVIITQEEERKRIARELHDETCQSLTALRLGIERLMAVPASDVEGVREQLSQSQRLCQQIEDEVDNLILDLRPSLLDDLGLIEAIRFYSQVRFKVTGIAATVRVIGEERRLSSEIEATVFRIMQECISNIVKHSHALHATVELQYNTHELAVRVEDDGCGFQVTGLASPHDPRRGMGLLGMRERINLIGGSLNVVSRPGAGTFIEAIVSVDS
jgi:signal transduction histidine kinase